MHPDIKRFLRRATRGPWGEQRLKRPYFGSNFGEWQALLEKAKKV